MSHKENSKEVWNEVFEKLDLSYSEKPINQGKLFELVKVQFLETIFPKKPALLLEVGCGTAFVSLYFAKRGYSVFCTDINKDILQYAQENFDKEGAKGKFKVADARRLPFRTGTFDIVASFGLLEHFADPKDVILEMTRVTKPGGLLFADIVPSRFSCQTIGNIWNSLASFFYWTLQGDVKKGVYNARKNFTPLYFENSLSWAQYKRIFKEAGLNHLQVNGNRPLPRLTLPASLDKLYTKVGLLFLALWKAFDSSGSEFARFWGAGLWVWGRKLKK